MKYNKYIAAFLVIFFSQVMLAGASESTGTINTGVNTGSGSGVVIGIPTASPSAGTYTSTQTVSLTSTSASAICYTTDNTDPSCASGGTSCTAGTLYSSTISVTSNTKIKAISCYSDDSSSSVGGYFYTIGSGQESASEPSNTSASTPTDSGGGNYTSTVTISSDTTVSGAADLSSAITSGGADTGDSVTTSGSTLTVQSSSTTTNKITIPSGTTMTVAGGTWSGVINPPVSVTNESSATTALSKTPEISVQMGDPNTKLDFGSSTSSQPTVEVTLANTTCSSSGYTVVRKSFGDSSYSSDGISSVSGTQSGSDCIVSFKTRYMSTFATANNSSSSSGGGGGGGGPSSSDPNDYTPYTLSVSSSTAIINLTKPLKLSNTDGLINRPIEMKNSTYDYVVEIPADTKVTYDDGSDFNGTINIPVPLPTAERPDIPSNFSFVKALKLGSSDGKSIKFSKDFELTIPVSFTKTINPDYAKVYYYDEDDKEYKIAGDGGTLSEDQKTITVKVNHMTKFAVLYSEGSTDAADDVVDEQEEEVIQTVTTLGGKELKFKDIGAHWAKNYIANLTEQGVFKDQDNFRPDDSLLRSELVKIVVEAFGLDTENYNADFSDVPNDAWYAPYVAAVKDLGIVKGYADGTFKPAAVVNRAEALKILLLAADLPVTEEIDDAFSDVPGNAWFAAYVTYAKSHGIVGGYGDGTFKPGNNVTRAEIAKIISVIQSLK